MRTETVYRCSKCGQVTPWDSSLSGPVLCQRHWDAATETDPERARYMRAYNRAYHLSNQQKNRMRALKYYYENRQRCLERQKEWLEGNRENFNDYRRRRRKELRQMVTMT